MDDMNETTTYYCVYSVSAEAIGAASSLPAASTVALPTPTLTPSVTSNTSIDGAVTQQPRPGSRELIVYCTDMDSDTEDRLKLRKTILHMMEKNLILESGTVGFLRNLMPLGGSSPSPNPSSSISSTTTVSSSAQYGSGKLQLSTGTFYAALLPASPSPSSSTSSVICLISLRDNDDTFSLFRSDLDRFTKELVPYFQTPSVAPDDLMIKLARWHTETFKYVTTAIVSLRTNALAILLHACLVGKSITITRSTNSSSICRLIEIVNLGFAPLQVSVSDNGAERHSSETHLFISTTVEHNVDCYALSSSETNSFCLQWAEHLVRLAATGDFVGIRQHLEFTKLQIHQEMLALTKTLEMGSIDNYALFDIFSKIKDHPNRDLLLILLLQHTTNKELKDSLETIYEYLLDIKVLTA
jgi:hypothetical protein